VSATIKDLTRLKISDREPCEACRAASGWMANTQKMDRSAARGSLHRLPWEGVQVKVGFCGAGDWDRASMRTRIWSRFRSKARNHRFKGWNVAIWLSKS